MGKRILTTLVGLPVLFFFLIKGGTLLTLALLGVTLIGLHEFYASVSLKNFKPASIVGFAATLLVYTGLVLGVEESFLLGIIPFGVMMMLIHWVLSHPRYRMEDMLITWFGFVYVTLLLAPIALINRMVLPHAVWLVFIISWACDSCAYMVGCGIGRHKLCPQISPKKTIEGAVGGLAGSMAGCALFAVLVMPDQVPALIILGFLGGLFSQLGDLSASLIKRTVGIKDFGSLFPGHGGVLDRFDSILFTAPVVYLFITWFLLP